MADKKTRSVLVLVFTAMAVLLGPVGAGGQALRKVDAPATGTNPSAAVAAHLDRSDDILWPVDRTGRSARLAGNGFNTLDDDLKSTIGTWVFRLRADSQAEVLRPGLQATADELRKITGGSYTVAAGTTTAAEPAWGEILVSVVRSGSACPEAAACAGPDSVFGFQNNGYITSGSMSVNPEALTYAAEDIELLMKHEIGHVLGLDHYDAVFQGRLQMMHSTSYDPLVYEAGDINGLRHQYNGFYGPFETEQNFVLTQFLALARRLPTNSELFNWSTKIKASRPAAFDLAGSLLDASANADLGALVRLYQAYFKRSPDQAGYTYWTTRLRAGRPLDDVSQSFAKSSEFTRTYGNLSNTAFVDLVYTNVLGRPADASGQAYWTGQLGKGTSRGAVMTGFSQSGEYRRTTAAGRRVVVAYTGLLSRVPTAAEYTGLAAALTDGTLTPAGLTRRLIESQSYGQRFL